MLRETDKAYSIVQVTVLSFGEVLRRACTESPDRAQAWNRRDEAKSPTRLIRWSESRVAGAIVTATRRSGGALAGRHYAGFLTKLRVDWIQPVGVICAGL